METVCRCAHQPLLLDETILVHFDAGKSMTTRAATTRHTWTLGRAGMLHPLPAQALCPSEHVLCWLSEHVPRREERNV
jgi:hypothetical protein